METRPAPEWQTTEWLNTSEPLSLAALRGRVVLVHAFQMLCPGCVAHGLPQAKRAAEVFAGTKLTVVGLHCVFEHHAAMGPISLKAFLHEYRIAFPVGIDAPGSSNAGIPRTMEAYAMRGTPSTLVFDSCGELRHHVFGKLDDLVLGSELRALLIEAEREAHSETQGAMDAPVAGCEPEGCAVAKEASLGA